MRTRARVPQDKTRRSRPSRRRFPSISYGKRERPTAKKVIIQRFPSCTPERRAAKSRILQLTEYISPSVSFCLCFLVYLSQLHCFPSSRSPLHVTLNFPKRNYASCICLFSSAGVFSFAVGSNKFELMQKRL